MCLCLQMCQSDIILNGLTHAHKCSYSKPYEQKKHVVLILCLQLKQVKREVALSRQRSLKLKAQVDRLEQQKESGPGWSENRQRVSLS